MTTQYNFTGAISEDQTISLKDFSGKYLVIYFYPKDATPGCTLESQDFRDLYTEFTNLNADIIGVSRDSLKSHDKFKIKENLPFQLIADTDESICKIFDVLKLKKNYGREYIGIDRSTFVFSPLGELIQEWRGVKVKGHAAKVLEFIQTHANS